MALVMSHMIWLRSVSLTSFLPSLICSFCFSYTDFRVPQTLQAGSCFREFALTMLSTWNISPLPDLHLQISFRSLLWTELFSP